MEVEVTTPIMEASETIFFENPSGALWLFQALAASHVLHARASLLSFSRANRAYELPGKASMTQLSQDEGAPETDSIASTEDSSIFPS